MKKLCFKFVISIVMFGFLSQIDLYSQTPIDLSGLDIKSNVSIKKNEFDQLLAEWRTSNGGRCAIQFDFKKGSALLSSLQIGNDLTSPMSTIATNLQPRFDVTLGTRGSTWPYVFFDKVDTRPFKKTIADLSVNSVTVKSDGPDRVNIIISKISAGSFSGDLVVKIYDGSPFILVEAAMKATEAGCAYIYDGLLGGTLPEIVYKSNESDKFVTEEPMSVLCSKTVRNRTIMAQFKKGTLAIFPAPHAFIYPLDFSDNYYGNVQAGKENGLDYFGTKSQPNGDKRFRPWIDAPYGKVQHMGFFLLLSSTNAKTTLDRVKKYTHNDTFKEIPGYITFANHFHAAIAMSDSSSNPSGAKFRQAMMSMNIKSVEIAEFHGDGNPNDTTVLRLYQLKRMFDVCKKYSIPGSFTMIPGEEVNGYFPGHTMYFFPKPVYLTLKRGKNQPFKEDIVGFGEVYHAGSEKDMYNIYKENGSLVWTSHPRIKASENEPDLFVDHAAFQDDSVFTAGDWKAMPLDLSSDRLGVRSLKLLNDINQLGFKKQIIGEVDLFKLDEPDEIYTHMNINYVKVSTVPTVSDWSPIINSIKKFDYFTSTGEVLIHSWDISSDKKKVSTEMEWTFPMAFAEITWAEGDDIKTKTINMNETRELVSKVQHFEWPVDLSKAKWVRFEAWDIARNGAFTPTKWLTTPVRTLTPVVYDFSLVNGDNGSIIPEFDPIKEGSVINLDKLPTQNIKIRANANLMATVNVVFNFDKKSDGSKLKVFPYQDSFVLTPGKHILEATPSIGEISGKTRVLNFIVSEK